MNSVKEKLRQPEAGKTNIRVGFASAGVMAEPIVGIINTKPMTSVHDPRRSDHDVLREIVKRSDKRHV